VAEDRQGNGRRKPVRLLEFRAFPEPADRRRCGGTRFAKIGVEAGKPFDIEKLMPEQRMEIGAGIKSSFQKIKETVGQLGVEENGWRVATHGFGDRQAYGGDYALRAAAAMAGIYGNDAVEALYPLLATDSDGKKRDTSANRYTLTFPAGQLPPVNAFGP
jgi:hypothetical protein